MDQKEKGKDQSKKPNTLVTKSKSEESVGASKSTSRCEKDVKFESGPKVSEDVSESHSPKFSRKYFTNWRHKTKDKTRELLRRWRTLPETDLPEEDPSETAVAEKGHGWSVHVWTTWVNRYSIENDGDNSVSDEEYCPPTLSQLQVEKMTLFFSEMLDQDRDELIGENDFQHFCERIAHFADWSYNSPEFHILLEVKNEFVENFISPLPPQYSEKMYWRRLASRLPREVTDLKNWLARWAIYLPACGRFHQLPLYLQYFCKILFAVINRSGSGIISRNELRNFYISVGGLSPVRCEEVIDTAYNYMTSNEYLELDFDTYKRCFSNWLCGKNPNGPGQWAVVPPRGPLSREPYPVDYSALNSDPGRLERYGPNNRTSRRSVIV